MLKNYRNFVNVSEDVVVNSHTINIRDLLNNYKSNWALACNELNRRLVGREIRVHEMVYDSKHNQFKWLAITPKFGMFNTTENIKDDWYIVFDDNCMVKLEAGLSVEHRIMLFDF